MKRKKWMIVLVLLTLVALALRTVSYAVDETRDLVVITQFGEFIKVIDGTKPGEAGLHFKMPYPIQSYTRYDSRSHILISPHTQCTTRQQHPFVVTSSCLWKITDARRFYETKTSLAQAEVSLRTLLQSEMASVIAKHDSESLVNTDDKKMKLQEIGQSIASNMNEISQREYGVTIQHVGIEALVLSEQTTTVVIEAMIKERQREIMRYDAEGKAVAAAIEGRALAARSMILDTAQRVAADIRTSGEAEAAKAYAELAKHPEFAMFLRSIESMRTILRGNTVFLLDASKLPTLQWLRQKPSLDVFRKAGATTPSTPTK